MGAAGYVTVVDEDVLREEYLTRTGRQLEQDWRYLADGNQRVVLAGRRWLVLYEDDQGNHEWHSDYWFNGNELATAEEIAQLMHELVFATTAEYKAETEVWT